MVITKALLKARGIFVTVYVGKNGFFMTWGESESALRHLQSKLKQKISYTAGGVFNFIVKHRYSVFLSNSNMHYTTTILFFFSSLQASRYMGLGNSSIFPADDILRAVNHLLSGISVASSVISE